MVVVLLLVDLRRTPTAPVQPEQQSVTIDRSISPLEVPQSHCFTLEGYLSLLDHLQVEGSFFALVLTPELGDCLVEEQFVIGITFLG